MKKFLILPILFGLALSSCQQEDVNPVGDSQSVQLLDVSDLITASACGSVTDGAGNPVSDALVTLGNRVVLTDNVGSFQIVDAEVRKNLAQVIIEKEGFDTYTYVLRPPYEEKVYVEARLSQQD